MTSIYLGSDTHQYILDSGRELTLTDSELNELSQRHTELALDNLRDDHEYELDCLRDQLSSAIDRLQTIQSSFDQSIDELTTLTESVD